AAAGAADEGLGAIVVGPSPDLAYLTGYDPPPFERPTVLVLRPHRDPTLVVPELERALAAVSGASGVVELATWRDGSDPYDVIAGVLPVNGRVGLSDRIWGVHVLGLQAVAPALSWTSASPVLAPLRARKDADELDALRRAGAAADATFEAICRIGLAGRTELDVADDLARLLVEHGHDTADFTIVASGPNGASPHHEPGSRRIARGDPVVLDFGGSLDGYFSDTTRTVVVGDAPDGLEDVFALVHEAQGAGVDTVGPGVAIQEVDRAARAVIAAGGFGDRFIHRTGHGIGLEVHEPPYAVEGDRTVLEPGMTFSVEPGIYLDGRFGVRIEDIVAVTDDGVERLNRSSRDLRLVG
ncbi:MAG: Xaa-Pro peptidase family protein, partial [Actinomycetota bacterium]|nr:Xaa-Pro peptidase family protein [Actinomycetota bacterium]